MDMHGKVLTLLQAHQAAEAMTLLGGQGKTLFDEARSRLEQDLKFNLSGARSATAASNVRASQQMEQAVGQTQQAIKAACDGDLTARVATGDKNGDLLKMAESINSLLVSMGGIVRNVKTAADEVYRRSEEISQGNASLSQRTEEQSSSLEQTASSMEEMTATVRQNADRAAEANQLAIAARDQADKGGAVTARAVNAMGEINSASQRIADIIRVIDDIAFQTTCWR